MIVPSRINFLTLACLDVERMATFFRALGWPEAPSSEPVHRVFQLENGVVLALYGAEHYERDYGSRAEGFRGFTLGLNLASRQELLAVHATLELIDGVQDLDEPVDSPHGFSGFSFRDPEGNVWDVAWKEGSYIDERGGLTWTLPASRVCVVDGVPRRLTRRRPDRDGPHGEIERIPWPGCGTRPSRR